MDMAPERSYEYLGRDLHNLAKQLPQPFYEMAFWTYEHQHVQPPSWHEISSMYLDDDNGMPPYFSSRDESHLYMPDTIQPFPEYFRGLSGYTYTSTENSRSSNGGPTSPSDPQLGHVDPMSPEPPQYISVPQPIAATSNAKCHPPEAPRTVEYTVTTEVDFLMHAIQAQSPLGAQSANHPTSASKPKKHFCPLDACHKSFTQRTHLDIHLRSHSGEKPFRCREPSCAQSFSQMGNLRTHERRHTGERPYICGVSGCAKRFAQRGNWRAHCVGVHRLGQEEEDETYPTASASGSDRGKTGRGRFECRLDDCGAATSGKWFTQLGNLKSHQNRFHKDTLHALAAKFRAGTMDFQDHELWAYFHGLYKNCNKGIKGRGKGRRVDVIPRQNGDRDSVGGDDFGSPELT